MNFKQKKGDSNVNNLKLFFLLATLWGPSFLFIKVAVAEIPPLRLGFGLRP